MGLVTNEELSRKFGELLFRTFCINSLFLYSTWVVVVGFKFQYPHFCSVDTDKKDEEGLIYLPLIVQSSILFIFLIFFKVYFATATPHY